MRAERTVLRFLHAAGYDVVASSVRMVDMTTYAATVFQQPPHGNGTLQLAVRLEPRESFSAGGPRLMVYDWQEAARLNALTVVVVTEAADAEQATRELVA